MGTQKRVGESTMPTHGFNRKSSLYRKLAGAALAASLFALPLGANAQAQQAAIFGSLGNFDAANFEGKDAFGFEIQIEGIQVKDLMPSWCGNNFGCPVMVPYATGVYVRYQSPYDPVSGTFTSRTAPHQPNTAFGGTCYFYTPTYSAAGCNHFGVHIAYTAAGSAARTVGYRWMFPDPANPAQLAASATNIFVPNPVYTFVPPAQPALPPVLVAEVVTPEPPPPPPALPPQYGDATWMKVFKTELQREVILDELVATNAIVPQDPAQVETNWVLMQPSPPPDGRHRQRNRHVNQGGVNAGTRAVIRRYETYAYTGAYDPVTHEATCADGTCTAPAPVEVGDMINAQMTAANVGVPGLAVTKAGTGVGNVTSADKVITCGSKCAGNYALGTVVTVTATPASNNAFTGWTGACTGTVATCAITISDAMNVTATFDPIVKPVAGGGGGGGAAGTPSYTLSVGRSNPGTVTGTPAGTDRALDCGNACSAKFLQDTIVTLTATPPAGKTFASWGGACSGNAPICSLNIIRDTSVQANFNK